MEPSQSDIALQVITWILVVANGIVYLSFNWLAALINKVRGREALARRWIGAMGVILFTGLVMWYLRTNFVKEDVLMSLPAFEQGEYIGRVLGTTVFPVVLVLGVVAFRGWRAKRSQIAESAPRSMPHEARLPPRL